MKDHGQKPDKGIKTGVTPISFNEVEKLTEAKYTIQKYKRILFYMVICVLLAAFLLGQYIYPSEREPVTEESITYTGTFYRVLADGTEEEIPDSGSDVMCLPESLWSSGQCSHRIIMKIRSPSGPLWRMCAFTSVGN